MLNKQRIRLAVIGFAAVIFFGCPSQEYTSANVYIQQEEWAKAKEFLIKAIEVEPDNPEIPYKLGYLSLIHIYPELCLGHSNKFLNCFFLA